MKAAKISHTVVLEKPDSPHLIASAAGLNPSFASCSGLNRTYCERIITRATPISPTPAPGRFSMIRPGDDPGKDGEVRTRRGRRVPPVRGTARE